MTTIGKYSPLMNGVLLAAMTGGFVWLWDVNVRVALIDHDQARMNRGFETLRKDVVPKAIKLALVEQKLNDIQRTLDEIARYQKEHAEHGSHH